jgi:hypothetical protein
LSLGVRNLASLDHELGDVRQEGALAESDFSEGDGGEELRENLVNVGSVFMSGSGGGGESGGKTVRFGSLLGEHIVVGAERRMRRGEVHAATIGLGRPDGCSGKIQEA